MAPALPEGTSAPLDGVLPACAAQGAQERSFSVYVHVPFCATRCGYCDFNTYTAVELGAGVDRHSYAAVVLAELDFAREILTASGMPERPVHTVFFGGGTPTLLPASDLGEILAGIRALWGLEDGAEVSTEANPDTLTPAVLESLASAGFTRVSVGMQSAVPHVLATLGRTHAPEGVHRAVRWAQEAGLKTSVDLIYGTPGESLADWRHSLEQALSYQPDHVSAYALTVEPGTALAAAVARGGTAPVSSDDQAEKYEIADEYLTVAGYRWYEISNWACGSENRCRHNIAYWRSQDWWGAGPGAHSHMGGVRWWNLKHPRPYSARMQAGQSPAIGREILTGQALIMERLMLEVRLADGLALEHLLAARSGRAEQMVAEGLLEASSHAMGRLILTRRGRLLADHVVQQLAG